MFPRRTNNPKRRLRSEPLDPEQRQVLARLAGEVRYGGNNEHKRSALNDFGLVPPARARPGKTLCDDVGITQRRVARRLLQMGLERGLVDSVWTEGWPKHVWAVSNEGIAVEAIRENAANGTYHGYPLQREDPLAEEVMRAWNSNA